MQFEIQKSYLFTKKKNLIFFQVFGNSTMTINENDLFKRGTNVSSNATENDWHQFIDIVRAKWIGML